MVFLDCGDFMCWLTATTNGAVVAEHRISELDVLRQFGWFTTQYPVEKFGDGF